MFSFFNKRSAVIASIQAYNIAAFVFAAYDLYTNPDASWDEQGVELAIHAVNVLHLREGTPMGAGLACAALNFAGFGAIFRGFTSDWSSVSPAVNVIGASGHIVSAVATTIVGCNSVETGETKFKPH